MFRFVNIIFFVVVHFSLQLVAQEEELEISAIVVMDEIVISADDRFDIDGIIDIVTHDSTFYQAFLNLKYYPHHFTGTMSVKNKDEDEKGTMYRTAIQTLSEDKYRSVEILENEVSDNIVNRKGEFKYLTAEMYDEIFFPKNSEKVSLKMTSLEQKEERGSKMDKYKSQVKKMMFNPGSAINSVPFIGDKLAIFSSEMIPYYDYHISSGYTRDSLYCYIFEVEAKNADDNNTVIKYMKSYFEKKTMYVVKREYSLKYSNMLLDFDIKMDVKNDIIAGHLLPKYIRYEGEWDIPFKKAERIKFTIDNYRWLSK